MSRTASAFVYTASALREAIASSTWCAREYQWPRSNRLAITFAPASRAAGTASRLA